MSNYNGGSDVQTNVQLKHALIDDLNRIIQSGPIYSPERFAEVKLPEQITKQLNQKLTGTNLMRLNRTLLSDAYPQEIKGRAAKEKQRFMAWQPAATPTTEEAGPEPFVLRLSILLLMTVSCYGVQVLSFRQRIAEEEVEKSAAKNDELKAAGRLAAEIAHQLKNPLGIINNAIFSLQRGLKEGRNDFTQQIEIIREEIDRSDRILTQLMGYGQLSEGRVEKLNLPEELDRAIAEVLPPGTSYATQIQRNYDANLPEMLMQRSHLSVVLVNLLQNAREALAGHGNIFVHAHSRNGNSVEISVGDDGPGIAADKLDKIFEAYFTTKEKGTGLGLAIVKHNVELYGGTVRVESELGKGARFILSFPAKTLIIKSLMKASLPPVLVVDDEKNMRLSLQTVLDGRRLRRARGGIRRGGAGTAGAGGIFHGHHRRAAGRHERLRISGKVHVRWPELARPDDHRLRHAQARGGSHQGRRD